MGPESRKALLDLVRLIEDIERLADGPAQRSEINAALRAVTAVFHSIMCDEVRSEGERLRSELEEHGRRVETLNSYLEDLDPALALPKIRAELAQARHDLKQARRRLD